jgi:hypothetical protein
MTKQQKSHLFTDDLSFDGRNPDQFANSTLMPFDIYKLVLAFYLSL